MNDRELLELAAKAAGEDVEWHATGSYFYRTSCNWPAEKGFFNPLHDDGEALRLAVELSISVDLNGMFVHADCRHRKDDIGYFEENSARNGGDMMRATRLAIVRAAAEIGRAMP